MLHGMMYQGSYDANVRVLAPGRETFVEGGAERALPPWPAAVDGIRFGALERRGRLLILRVAYADLDVILHQPVVLDPARHLGGGRPPGPEIAPLSDDLAETVLDDVLAVNPDQTNAIALVVNRVNQVRRASREAAARAAATDADPQAEANG